MVEGYSLQIDDLDRLLTEWFDYADINISESGRELERLTREVILGNEEVKERRLRVLEKHYNIRYQVLMLGLLMEIRNNTLRTAEQINDGIWVVGGNVNATIDG